MASPGAGKKNVNQVRAINICQGRARVGPESGQRWARVKRVEPELGQGRARAKIEIEPGSRVEPGLIQG